MKCMLFEDGIFFLLFFVVYRHMIAKLAFNPAILLNVTKK